jgi:hypothetical protein
VEGEGTAFFFSLPVDAQKSDSDGKDHA